MVFFKQFKKKEVFCLFVLTTIFLLSRLYNLLLIPIFTDEAIYLRWAQIAKNDAAWRFISLTDGKQPLFVWLTMVSMRFLEDPLLAGRLVSTGAGFLSMVGLFFLGKELFKKRLVGIIASIFYIIFPYALVYDRMALMDGMVGTFSIWSLYFTVLLVRTLRLDIALILGMIMGGGVLTKSTGFLSVYLLPFSLLLFGWKNKNRFKNLVKWGVLAAIAVIETYVIYSVLRLSPFFHIIEQKNAVFVYPFSEWIKHPFHFWWGNIRGLWDWFVTYATWPIVLLIVACFFFYLKYTKEKLLVFIWFTAPFLGLALFARVLYPRFVFFMTLPLLTLVALSFIKLYEALKNKRLFAVCCLLILILPSYSGYLILTNPTASPIPFSDKDQYLNNWPAGGGVKEAVVFFKELAKTEKIYIATEGTFGLMPYSLELYLVQHPNIEIGGFWPLSENPPREILEKSREKKTYFVFNQTQVVPPKWPLSFIAKYQKGSDNVYLSIYQVNP